MRVLVITTNLSQASFRLRIDQLRAPLAERGIELDAQVRPRGWSERRRLLASSRDYDAVILQRKLLDPSDARLLRRSAQKIFYDIDDAVMFHAHRVGRLAQWRTNRRLEATARIVDHVVAGNSYLAAMFNERGPATTVLPTTVAPEHYRAQEHRETDQPRLVWIGSHSTLPYLEAAMPAIEAAGVGLITIADASVASSKIRVEHVTWSEATEAEALVRGDIGIAPTPCDRWTLGKCGFKIIQYMAAGLPVIASPVGANAEIVRDGETGLLVDSPAQWTDAIVKLSRDAALRKRMGEAGRRRVEMEYSLDRAVNCWARLLAE